MEDIKIKKNENEIRLKIAKICFSLWKEKGIIGENNNSKIINFFKEIRFGGIKNDDTPWCAAFVSYVLLKAGLPFQNSLLARSYIDYKTERKEKPDIFDIVIFSRGAKNGPFGHVGFYIGEDKDTIHILGGNQNNEVNISSFPKYDYIICKSVV
jgi:uncharacterized protein (TIGR02594 family)